MAALDRGADRLLPFFADCARRAEAVRENGAEVGFGAGCEMSAFCGGFIPGDTYGDRLRTIGQDTRRRLHQQSCEANLSPARGVRVGDRALILQSQLWGLV
ncbi:hypothetical protein ACF1BP_36920 [Streptomyces sp. NPDC014735]|uniref:hypothetical protein n=1 Tax=unclassified Streptomyces TaxID=2593676 RepID=UPI00370224C5